MEERHSQAASSGVYRSGVMFQTRGSVKVRHGAARTTRSAVRGRKPIPAGGPRSRQHDQLGRLLFGFRDDLFMRFARRGPDCAWWRNPQDLPASTSPGAFPSLRATASWTRRATATTFRFADIKARSIERTARLPMPPTKLQSVAGVLRLLQIHRNQNGFAFAGKVKFI